MPILKGLKFGDIELIVDLERLNIKENNIKDIHTTDNYELKWKAINEEEVYHLLVKEHNFGEERVKNKLEALREVNKKLSQKGLGSFF